MVAIAVAADAHPVNHRLSRKRCIRSERQGDKVQPYGERSLEGPTRHSQGSGLREEIKIGNRCSVRIRTTGKEAPVVALVLDFDE